MKAAVTVQPMKNIYIKPNTGKAEAMAAASKAVPYLLSHNLNIYAADSARKMLGIPNIKRHAADKKYDLIIVFGGDGTILAAAHEFAGTDIPILGVNFGRLGYLCQTELGDFERVLDKYFSGDFTVEKRAVLDCTVNFTDGEKKFFNAFNDITIHRGASGGLLSTEININSTYMDSYSSDGIIACTPTGSTAYNFSAGGPIVNPIARNIILTPICSHTVFSRSIVLMQDDILTLTPIIDGRKIRPLLSADGVDNLFLKKPCKIDIKISDIEFPLIRTDKYNFYDTIREKMIK